MNRSDSGIQRCIGVDGCPAGWVGVSRSAVYVEASLKTLVERFGATIVALDMPIGLPEQAPRECERMARRLLGRPRAASVFPVPMRAALAGRSHSEASELNQAACGKRLSAQTFNIMPKIRAVDCWLNDEPDYQTRVWETHPEISFAAMNCPDGQPEALGAGKKTPAGRAERQQLIAQHFGAAALPDARRAIARRAAADDDIADAFACLFTAERIAAGRHISLPYPAPGDAQGLPMRICY